MTPRARNTFAGMMRSAAAVATVSGPGEVVLVTPAVATLAEHAVGVTRLPSCAKGL